MMRVFRESEYAQRLMPPCWRHEQWSGLFACPLAASDRNPAIGRWREDPRLRGQRVSASREGREPWQDRQML